MPRLSADDAQNSGLLAAVRGAQIGPANKFHCINDQVAAEVLGAAALRIHSFCAPATAVFVGTNFKDPLVRTVNGLRARPAAKNLKVEMTNCPKGIQVHELD